MTRSIRLYHPDDYPLLESWWQGHGWSPVPARVLPRLGAIGLIDDKPVAAAFLYMDNGGTGVCMMEWIVADPAAHPRHVALTICSVADFLEQEAKLLDYAIMLTTCRQDSLSKLLTRQGYEVTDRDVIHHVKILSTT